MTERGRGINNLDMDERSNNKLNIFGFYWNRLLCNVVVFFSLQSMLRSTVYFNLKFNIFNGY